MKPLSIRTAKPADLPAVTAIEYRCFEPCRRFTRRSLQHSLHSPAQTVWVAMSRNGREQEIAGVIILRRYRRSIRIMSLAVAPEFRKSGIGRRLVRRTMNLARKSGFDALILEADLRDRKLTRWYAGFGFEPHRILQDYYSPGRHGIHMRMKLFEGAARRGHS